MIRRQTPKKYYKKYKRKISKTPLVIMVFTCMVSLYIGIITVNIDKEIVSCNLPKENTKMSMLWPVPSCNIITSPYGMRIHPKSSEKKIHKGIDIGAQKGDIVIAVKDGRVVESRMTKGYGNMIIIEHDKKTKTLYAHLNSRSVKEGEIVKGGEEIGTVGSTGISTGPHLHIEVIIDNEAQNPLIWLENKF